MDSVREYVDWLIQKSLRSIRRYIYLNDAHRRSWENLGEILQSSEKKLKLLSPESADYNEERKRFSSSRAKFFILQQEERVSRLKLNKYCMVRDLLYSLRNAKNKDEVDGTVKSRIEESWNLEISLEESRLEELVKRNNAQ